MTTSWATSARTVVGLPHDPCPGDPQGVRGLARDLRDRADLLRSAGRACRGWDPAGWTGRAATTARAAVLDLADDLAGLAASFDGGADVLQRWAVELTGLQEEAADLGARADDTRHRHALAGVRAATSPEPAATVAGLEQEHLVREHRDLLGRADRLHERWVAACRRAAGLLDEQVPADGPLLGRLWAGGVDAGQDVWQRGVRRQARVMAWTADGVGAAATVSGLVALAVPATAPVAAPLALALGGASTGLLAQLAAGAGGSRPAVATSALGLAVGGAATGMAGAVARPGTLRRLRLARAVDGSGTALPLAADLHALTGLRGDGESAGTVVGTDGGAVPVTVHDVAEPWHVGHGWSGEGFADVATVPVPAVPPPPAPVRPQVPAPQVPAAQGPPRPTPGSTTAPAPRPVPTSATPSPTPGAPPRDVRPGG